MDVVASHHNPQLDLDAGCEGRRGYEVLSSYY
jgi:hypothetical protein